MLGRTDKIANKFAYDYNTHKAGAHMIKQAKKSEVHTGYPCRRAHDAQPQSNFSLQKNYKWTDLQ